MTVTTTLSHDPLAGAVLSRKTLRKKNGPRDPYYMFLDRFALQDTVNFTDDFLVDTINLDNYALGNGGGSSAVAYAVTVARDGWIRGTTGTAGDATTTQSLITPAIWYGDANAEVIFRVKPITAVTETRIELGFVDVVPGSNKAVVNSLTSPTVNTSVVDAALFVYNHTGSTTTTELVTIGTTISAAKTAITMPTAVAASTIFTVRLKLQTNTVMCWVDGQLVAQHNAAGIDYIEGSNPVALFALVQALNGTSKSLDIDFLHAAQDRNN